MGKFTGVSVFSGKRREEKGGKRNLISIGMKHFPVFPSQGCLWEQGCVFRPVCLQAGPAITRARKRAAGTSPGSAGAAAPLLSPGCCLRLPGMDGDLGRAICTAGNLTAPATKYRGMPWYPKERGSVSVELDLSEPAQVPAACCPPSGCAAPVPGLFMSSQQANTAVTFFS